MLGEDPLRTVECLRGRLQAERAASRAAEHNAYLLAQKLKELEKQLKIEAKLSRKAEKKLNFLKKKLESLNIPLSSVSVTISEEIDGSISSNSSEISCMSSIASTSFSNNQQHEDLNLLDTQLASKSSSIASEITEERESEKNVEHKIINQMNSGGDPTNGEQQSDVFCHGSDESGSKKRSIKVENENQDYGNEMALVPMTSTVDLNNSSKSPLEIKGEKVKEVLDALKLIRENLQNTLEKRRIINVG